MAAHEAIDKVGKKLCFVCGPCHKTISELVSYLVRGLLQFNCCELLLLEGGS
jgi:hypothetical protein